MVNDLQNYILHYYRSLLRLYIDKNILCRLKRQRFGTRPVVSTEFVLREVTQSLLTLVKIIKIQSSYKKQLVQPNNTKN